MADPDDPAVVEEDAEKQQNTLNFDYLWLVEFTAILQICHRELSTILVDETGHCSARLKMLTEKYMNSGSCVLCIFWWYSNEEPNLHNKLT